MRVNISHRIGTLPGANNLTGGIRLSGNKPTRICNSYISGNWGSTGAYGSTSVGTIDSISIGGSLLGDITTFEDSENYPTYGGIGSITANRIGTGSSCINIISYENTIGTISAKSSINANIQASYSGKTITKIESGTNANGTISDINGTIITSGITDGIYTTSGSGGSLCSFVKVSGTIGTISIDGNLGTTSMPTIINAGAVTSQTVGGFSNALINGDGTATLISGDLLIPSGNTIKIGGAGEGTLNLGNASSSGRILGSGGRNISFVVRNQQSATGLMTGWWDLGTSTAKPTGSLTNNGRVVANGFDVDRNLDLSSFTSVNNTIPNGTTEMNGWYAENKGQLVLPAMAVATGNGKYNWGEAPYDSVNNPSIDLVNSMQLAFAMV